jgi:phosphate transport system permease protein
MATTALPPTSPMDLSGDPRRHRKERFMGALFFVAAATSLLVTVLILYSLFSNGWDFFSDVEWSTVFDSDAWNPRQSSFSLSTIVSATLIVTGIAMIVATPLGLGAAVYLSEYARPRMRTLLKPILEVLAGVPTIVFGYFALTFFTPEILRGLFGIEVGIFNALSAGLIMGLLVLPTIASVAEDAMSAVPAALREGAFGLGASKLQVSLRIVFPAALSGIVAALVLGASRAIGETVLVLIAAGQTPNLGVDPRESFQTMAAYIAAQARGDIPAGSIEYLTIFAVGFTLFVLTLALNIISIRLVRRYRQVYE